MEPTQANTNRVFRRPLILGAVLAALTVLAGAGLYFAGTRQGLDLKYGRAVQKAQMVADLRADLYAAAEAEKCAVLAETDQASEAYAALARAAVGRMSAELARLQGMEDSDATGDRLARDLAQTLDEYRKVDEEVLNLAVQNTNLKALALTFGQASTALADMEQALGPMRNRPEALRALAEALRIQSLHAPHIMEKTEARMDALEQDMARADKAVWASLDALAAQTGGPEQAAARAAYDRYWKTTLEVVRLSRQNTNVRSFSLSLERKGKVLAACNEALRVLSEHLRERMGTRATR
ncbi:MAG: hypothetical protein KKF77_00200 [Proteobacteria bacterium]|nr:hypothetical protein [Pseudomonadota bacterium]